MRIGIMLRALDEKGGVGVFTRYSTQELLNIDRRNHYILFYRNASHLGHFSHYDNVTERVMQAPNKGLWDQAAIPYACWKEKVDVLFHPKFTVPLLAPCKTVMVLHGAGWFMPEYQKFWKNLDLTYLRAVMPLYCRKAAVVLSVSQLTTDTFNRVFNLPEGKVKTVYFGPGKQFKPVEHQTVLETIKQKYNLPDHFIFTLSGYDRGQRKNIDGILKAYKIHHGKTSHKLVIGGKDCDKFKLEYGIPNEGYGKDILFPGWIEQADLPAIYSLADLYLYPSYSEAFPIPLTEAMACGAPIITSNLNGLKEIAGNAALFVDADDPGEIAQAMHRVLTDAILRQSLADKSRERSRQFSWEKWGKQTLAILESLNHQRVGQVDVC